MAVKIRLPWKYQIAWAKTCHTKLLPCNLHDLRENLQVWWRLIQKVINDQNQRRHFQPRPPRPNKVKHLR